MRSGGVSRLVLPSALSSAIELDGSVLVDGDILLRNGYGGISSSLRAADGVLQVNWFVLIRCPMAFVCLVVLLCALFRSWS